MLSDLHKKRPGQPKVKDFFKKISPDVKLRKTVASLAKEAPSLVPMYLNYVVGKASYGIGKLGEKIAARVVERDLDFRVTQIAKVRGVDIIAMEPGNSCLFVEVKTSNQGKPFGLLLKESYGYKQMQ